MKSTIAKKSEGYGYKYTELADINKYCEDNGIRYYQEVETSEINQKDYIVTYLVKDNETTKHRGCQIVEAVLQGIKNPVQEYGSSLTYCRRYSLLMALGLATEDDDAASCTKELTKEDAEAYTFAWGKYKSKKLSEVPENYLNWVLDNSNDANAIKMIELYTGQKSLTEAEKKEKLSLMVKLDNLLRENDVARQDIYDDYGVTDMSQMSIGELKDAIGGFNG